MHKTLNYAIGDVHGSSDLLASLIDACLDDASRNGAEPRFVFLGDLIDKGRNSRGALDKTCEVLCDHAGLLVRGNHEQLAVTALVEEDPDSVRRWLVRGGTQTLESYCPGDIETAFSMLPFMHSDHLRLMESSVSHFVDGPFFFTHAGVDPAKPLESQSEHDLAWIRAPFLDHVGMLSKVVIHGHTPVGDLPVVTENRVSIDTGAYLSGRLTACVSDGATGELRFLQTDGGPRRVVGVEAVRVDRGLGVVTDHADPVTLRMAA
jgi:serine/threonine protein phosphatase 1